jgi:lipopolysaccharide/colanic/teichoic acid biosynthesis glycosyltransferase
MTVKQRAETAPPGVVSAGPRTSAHPVAARAAAFARRAIDLVAGTVLLVILAPLLAAVAIAVRLDSKGPAIYRQRRIGRRGREFEVNKFRSMRSDANSARHRDYVEQLINNRPESDPPENGLYKLVVDDRITRVGRILRSWSLDELPQLWNVVRGDMSLVGPRPVIPYEVELYPDWYHERFAVKPGLTGLWQVSGRSECTYEEMVVLDVEYVRRRTLPLDLAILARTVWVVVTRRGAA